MRAMLLEQTDSIFNSPLREVEIASPVPGPGEVAIEVTACGVCHTDLHTVEGDLTLPVLPLIPGHQIVGEVKACSDGASRFRMGDRVGVGWLNQTCGTCRFCASGRENLCAGALFTGFDRMGGYAENICVPEGFVYQLPGNFDDLQAAPLLCGGIIGYRALKLAGIEAGGRLGLYGFGASAHVTIQIARSRGMEVYVFSRGKSHRRLAEELGAAWTGNVPGMPPHSLDASIIFAPAGELVPPALEALDRGGTLVLAGIHMSRIPSLQYQEHLYFEKKVRSVTASTRQDGDELLRTASDIPVKTRVEAYPLGRANEALMDLKRGSVQGAAVLVI